jgi:hypothetical protein
MIQAKNRAEELKNEEMKDSGYGTNTNNVGLKYIKRNAPH